ncbi:MAG: pre-peptidase C-terminal domain-containing protein [Undibacterium sp.]|nr:pre-peptidase C-terminal domain-containing protein [Undibacterium sp.]
MKPKNRFALRLSMSLMSALFASISSTTVLAQADKISAQDIGSVENVINAFAAQHKSGVVQLAASVNGTSIAANIRDFYQKDGVVSVSGTALNTPNSQFYLKGNQQSLQGYMIFNDTKRAYEYSTNVNGRVLVNEVPITAVVPDLHPDWLKMNRTQGLTMLPPSYSPMAQRQTPFIGPYNNEDLIHLQSRPGSSYVFYLDTREVMNGSTPLNGVAKEAMFRMWQIVSGIYSPYNLNITTDLAVYNTAKTANLSRTGIAHFYNTEGRANAPLNSWGTTATSTIYKTVEAGMEYGFDLGMTTSHEMGHQMGMSHDGGGTGGEYYEGIAAFQWGPIMGNYYRGASWPASMWTWSKGEYSTANNHEDDLNMMNSKDAIPYIADDNPTGKALVIDASGGVSPSANWGQIERTSDTDSFTFTTGAGGGVLNLNLDRIEYFGMLDVSAKIVNSAGVIVASSSPTVDRKASFTNLALPTGSYSLVVAGGAEGTPANGFSNYSSLGYYAMSGTCSGCSGVIGPVETPLTKDVPINGIASDTGAKLMYRFEVPSNVANLSFTLSGGTGNADLYTQLNANPTTTTYLAKSDGASNAETITIAAPAAGTYKLLLNTVSAVNGASLVARYQAVVGCTGTVLCSGQAVTGIALATNATKLYSIVVPAGKTSLTFKLSGGTGDGDIFAKFGTAPTTTVYDKKSDGATNNETISFSAPTAGTYYLLLKGYSAISGVSLLATVQ